LVVSPRQVYDDDIVTCVGESVRFPEHPSVVDDRFVKQNGYAHRNSRPSLLFSGCMRRLTVLLGLAATLILATASGAQAAEKSIWGPSTFAVGDLNCPTGPDPCSAFPVYKQLGAENYQFQIPWDTVALSRPGNPRDPNDPAYHWPSFADFNVQQAAQYGISLAVLVQGTPAWANGGRSRAWAPANPQDYADFMYAISKRYPTIHRWEIWGEPSYGINFQPMPPNSRLGPRTYAKLLDRAYVALKQTNRANVVIGGMTLNGGGPVSTPDFVKWLRVGKGKNARPPRMDLWGHNPFEARFPKLKKKPIGKFRGLDDVDTLHREIQRAYGLRGKGKGKKARVSKKRKIKVPGLWLSEWTVLSEASANLFGGFHVTPQQQAAYISAAYRMVNKLKYVKGLGWYRLEDEASGNVSAAWGLLNANGARKPSFNAYVAAP
jgi:hypothetical protein